MPEVSIIWRNLRWLKSPMFHKTASGCFSVTRSCWCHSWKFLGSGRLRIEQLTTIEWPAGGSFVLAATGCRSLRRVDPPPGKISARVGDIGEHFAPGARRKRRALSLNLTVNASDAGHRRSRIRRSLPLPVAGSASARTQPLRARGGTGSTSMGICWLEGWRARKTAPATHRASCPSSLGMRGRSFFV